MSDRLANRTALVTGAGQGMGRAIALAFASEGAQVLATSRTAAKMANMSAANGRIVATSLDVSNPKEVAAFVADAPPVDILVNCAGWVADGPLLGSDDADWEQSWAINVMGPMRLIRAVLPGMLAQGRGVSSMSLPLPRV